MKTVSVHTNVFVYMKIVIKKKNFCFLKNKNIDEILIGISRYEFNQLCLINYKYKTGHFLSLLYFSLHEKSYK